MKELPNDLKKWRVFRGHTQAELAKLTGVSLASIAKIENENWIPSYTLARKVAEALDVNVLQIWTGGLD